MTASIEFWHVQMPDGSVSTMTLDELDDAFQSGKIDERTRVLVHGKANAGWATLGALLGLDDAPAAPSATPPPVVAAVASVPPPAPLYSLRPVVSEIDDADLDFGGPQFRGSKKRKVVIAGSIAAAAALGIAVAVFGSSEPSPPRAAAAQPPAAAPAPPPPPASVDTAAASAADRFTDAQKKALADADKSRAAQAAQKAAARAASAPVHHSSYKSDGKPVFHKGGDKHDPLNSSL